MAFFLSAFDIGLSFFEVFEILWPSLLVIFICILFMCLVTRWARKTIRKAQQRKGNHFTPTYKSQTLDESYQSYRNYQTKTIPTNNTAYYPYKKRPFLMTKSELRFYYELLPIANREGLTVFSKVRIADLLEAQGRGYAAFNKIAMKHVDFVLCDKQSRPLLAVELDDPTHNRPDREKRDLFVDQAMKAAQFPVLHAVNEMNLAAKIKDMLGAPVAARR